MHALGGRTGTSRKARFLPPTQISACVAARHLYALVTGVLIVYYPFGSGIIHALPMAICAYLALLVAPRRAGTIAWCTVFPYLIYL